MYEVVKRKVSTFLPKKEREIRERGNKVRKGGANGERMRGKAKNEKQEENREIKEANEGNR